MYVVEVNQAFTISFVIFLCFFYVVLHHIKIHKEAIYTVHYYSNVRGQLELLNVFERSLTKAEFILLKIQ